MKKLVVLLLMSVLLTGCSGDQEDVGGISLAEESVVQEESELQESSEPEEDLQDSSELEEDPQDSSGLEEDPQDSSELEEDSRDSSEPEKDSQKNSGPEESKEKDEEETSEISNRTQASLSVGNSSAQLAKRGANAAMVHPLANGETICVFYVNPLSADPGDTEKYKVKGNITNALVDEKDKAYFMMDDCLYQYTYGEEEELLLSDLPYGALIGEIGSRVYFQYDGPEMDVVTKHLMYYDTETGQSGEIAAEDLQGNVDALIGGEHFFYIGGRTDPSAKPLYEIDTDSLRVTKIDDHVVTMAYDEAGNLYYTASESVDYLSNPLIVKKYETETGKISEIFRETGEQDIGSLIVANENALYFESYQEEGTVLSCWDFEKNDLVHIKSGVNLKYIPNCEYRNKFYLSQYTTDSEGKVAWSELYEYLGSKEDPIRHVTDGLRLVTNEINGEILAAAADGLFYTGPLENDIQYRIEVFHIGMNMPDGGRWEQVG